MSLTDRGEATIKVFGLNRSILVRGRRNAYRITPLLLSERRDASEKGDVEGMADCATAVWEQPTAEVVQAMFHQAVSPGAEDVFAEEPQTLALLRDPVIRTGLLPTS